MRVVTVWWEVCVWEQKQGKVGEVMLKKRGEGFG